jgi:hypothetical protein
MTWTQIALVVCLIIIAVGAYYGIEIIHEFLKGFMRS